jgi:bifunctional non-homologous end joining protein LigD
MRRSRSASDQPPNLPVKELQLATLVKTAPEGDDWVHEIKFDGYRICAVIAGGAARLYTRKFLDWTPSMQPVADALVKLPVERAILDGEVCTLLPDGRSSFPGLHEALAGEGAELVYMVFDALAIDGESLIALPLEERKARIAALLAPTKKTAWSDHVRYSDHITGSGGDFFRVACERGLEGIISKQRRDPYRSGRGMSWVKTKCLQRQELVIGGYTEPTGGRVGFGAVLVGHYEGRDLRYAGKVGTGFGTAMLDELYREMTAREVEACPFSPAPSKVKTGPRVHWVRPELVCEVAFMEWTPDGALRHPSFQGLRRDKPAREVRREHTS